MHPARRACESDNRVVFLPFFTANNDHEAPLRTSLKLTTLVWFRNDLRLEDNPALHDACEQAGAEPVVAVYLVSLEQHRAHHEGARRLGFVHESLLHLRESLTRLSIPLWVVRAPRFADAPPALLDIARRCGAGKLYFNAEYPLNEARRDRQVRDACLANGIDCRIRHGDLIMPPGTVLTAAGAPYRVYTPFKRRWLQQLSDALLEPLPAPVPLAPRVTVAVPEPDALADLDVVASAPDWPAGEASALSRLDAFLAEKLDRYAGQRDFPGKAATSRLSPYLSVGAVSVRTCYHRAATLPGAAADPWLNELIWREFYRHVVSHYPHISMGRSFKPGMDALDWRHDPEGLDAWQQGLTGYPLVDAGMRQLKESGFMHNRLRMITAMFLTKHLLIHWREGERHFMQELRDGDFASNNGGWQWSASTGTDAVPYFRIFNPASQARKFDKDESFVRRFVPEYGTDRYPAPIVSHPQARSRALDTFRRD